MIATWKQFCRWLGAILLAWGAVRTDDLLPVLDPAIPIAVHVSFAVNGLPIDQYNADFDVEHTGKLHGVLHYAARELGIDHGLHTVGDVIAFLAFVQKAQQGHR